MSATTPPLPAVARPAGASAQAFPGVHPGGLDSLFAALLAGLLPGTAHAEPPAPEASAGAPRPALPSSGAPGAPDATELLLARQPAASGLALLDATPVGPVEPSGGGAAPVAQSAAVGVFPKPVLTSPAPAAAASFVPGAQPPSGPAIAEPAAGGSTPGLAAPEIAAPIALAFGGADAARLTREISIDARPLAPSAEPSAARGPSAHALDRLDTPGGRPTSGAPVPDGLPDRPTLAPGSSADRLGTIDGSDQRPPVSSTSQPAAPAGAPQSVRLAGFRPAPAAAAEPAPPGGRIEPAARELSLEAPGEIGEIVAGRGPRPGEAPGAASRTAPPPPSAQIALQIGKAAGQGIERLVVQLEPAELGRVEIRLEFGHERQLHALISAERPDTLHLLQRDGQALERSLQEAGLRLEAGGLSFSLKGEQGQGGGLRHQPPTAAALGGAAEPSPAEPADAPSRALSATLRLLDIHA